ncbi:MAG TPA: sulfotransferase [Minicystis sp.]|nr:sulfotransferase [Minicystis sp.]
MTNLRVVGAGLGRTGTHSLKIALERLLGGKCHHMVEVLENPHQVAPFRAAAEGAMPDWRSVLAGYVATVDWPTCAFWRELAAEHPDAIVLLSTRRDAAAWWKSANETIFVGMRQGPPYPMPMLDMAATLVKARFCADVSDREAAIAAYERHNAAVRAEVPKHRLLAWQPGDGWEPLCKALGVPVPDEPFPHVNTTEEFQAHVKQRLGQSHGGAP